MTHFSGAGLSVSTLFAEPPLLFVAGEEAVLHLQGEDEEEGHQLPHHLGQGHAATRQERGCPGEVPEESAAHFDGEPLPSVPSVSTPPTPRRSPSLPVV